ncbi:MAG: hypothetical protein DWQ05_04880 [Calditrichaeota bacterium]|nr:MAG: hypothetical protein DWQ05_04880 [Calditrichota bacterium]
MTSKALFIFIIVLIFITGCGPLGEARKSYDAEDYSGALAKANAQIAEDSTNTAAWILAGDCYAKLQKLENASAAFEKALLLNSTDSGTKRKLSAVYIQRVENPNRDARQALSLLNKAEKYTPKSFTVFYNRGRVYSELAYLKKSRADFLRAREISPNDPRPDEQLALLDQKQEKAEKLYHGGISAYKKKKWITATKYLSQAAGLNKEYVDAVYMSHMAKGRRAFKKGSVSALWDGIAELGFATQLKPQEAEPWFVMAQCYEKKDRNDFTSAIEPYEKVIALAPDSRFAKQAKIQINKLNDIRERREKFFGKKNK